MLYIFSISRGDNHGYYLCTLLINMPDDGHRDSTTSVSLELQYFGNLLGLPNVAEGKHTKD